MNNADFLTLVDHYTPYILRIVRSKTSYENEDIKDISQEILIKIYKSKDAIDYNKNLKGLIYSISLNECRNWYRKSKKHMDNVSLEDNICHLYVCNDHVGKQHLFDAINSLKDSDKRLFMLKAYYGYTYKDISKKYFTTMTSKQLKSRFCYIKKNLKKSLSRQGYNSPA